MRLTRAAWISGGAALVVVSFVLPVYSVIPDTDLAFLTAPVRRASDDSGFLPHIVRPILGVLMIGTLMLGALYLAYKRRRREAESELIQVLAASPVAQGVMVQIIDAGGVLFVMALSRNGQTLLGQITDRERISEIRTRVSQETLSLELPPIPFKDALKKWFKPLRAASGPSPAKPDRPTARERVLQEHLERLRRLNPTEKKEQP